MFRKRFVSMAAAIACAVGLCTGAAALEVDCDSVYCFQTVDFSAGEQELQGICILQLPDVDAGTVMLDNRVLREGDILTAQQVARMTFLPLQSKEDKAAQVVYLPIYEDYVAASATMTLSIRGKENQPPVAEDSLVETYKNLPNEGKLKVKDPEGKELTLTLTRQPKRGSVELREDGSFTYTPKKNKVGTDSFCYTATDPAGNVSREATVTVKILKPSSAAQYTDTAASPNRFAAEWMKNTGLFIGEQVGGEYCFNEEKTVSKGEFIAMAVKSLGIPVEEDAQFTGYTDEVPSWFKPYLAAALRAGLTAGLPVDETGALGIDKSISGAEAAVILQNAMDLAVQTMGDASADESVPAWAQTAVSALSQSGISIAAGEAMNRGQVAQLLYQASAVAETAPGLQMYR